MKANFRIHVGGMTGQTAKSLSDAIFNFMFEQTRNKIGYGFLPIRMEDVIIKDCLFTLCDRSRGLSKENAIMVRAFVHGWFYTHPEGTTLYQFEWC